MKKLRSIGSNILKENDNGFTILEMLVVIVVIGVLSFVATTTFVGFRKDAIHATLIEDVWHAGTKLQRVILFSDDPGQVPTEDEIEFFVSNENNILSIKVIANPKGSYCVIGNNDQYEDITIYYSSEQGGITTDETICGEPADESNDGIDTDIIAGPVAQPAPEPTTGDNTDGNTNGESNTNPNGEPTDTSTTEQSTEPTPEPNYTVEPTDGSTDINGEPLLAYSNNYPEYGPGMATVIPTSLISVIEMNIPSDTCKALLSDKVKTKAKLYHKIKYYNLVSIMARLQQGNHTLESILKDDPDAIRLMEINKKIATNKKCSDYVNSKATVTRYYAESYNAEQAAYNEFLWNLDENSANTEAYVNAYVKLYDRVYKLNQQ